MAAQRQFERDEQGDRLNRSDVALAPARGVGSRSASFMGGDIDPTTGNLVPGSRQAASKGFTVTGSENPAPTPPPTPNLGQVVADNPLPAPTPVQEAPTTVDDVFTGGGRKDKSNVVQQVGKWFCYGAGTPILMADGSWKAVEAIRLNDRVALGGLVTARSEAVVEGGETVLYRDMLVSKSHAVFHQGRFVRVGDVDGALPANLPNIVFPVGTENHLLVTQTHIAADFTECPGGYAMTPEQRLAQMNADPDRLRALADRDAELYRTADAA